MAAKREESKAERTPYVFKASREFIRSLNALDEANQDAAYKAFEVFKNDPFAPSLRTHKIAKLSARARTTIWAVYILPDLRATFKIDGNEVISLDIGSHDIYK